eukprot:TRINITY_DN16553_c0_g1_i3.p1 TRINITY_DN16553_c0_g1~~TRINITY_DN16553_c0_g1_i3.p1  ORF type:complete len:449 (-),score=76.60 TRINITY_DN16553_c0_g1_i3:98-1444(-)
MVAPWIAAQLARQRQVSRSTVCLSVVMAASLLGSPPDVFFRPNICSRVKRLTTEYRSVAAAAPRNQPARSKLRKQALTPTRQAHMPIEDDASVPLNPAALNAGALSLGLLSMIGCQLHWLPAAACSLALGFLLGVMVLTVGMDANTVLDFQDAAGAAMPLDEVAQAPAEVTATTPSGDAPELDEWSRKRDGLLAGVRLALLGSMADGRKLAFDPVMRPQDIDVPAMTAMETQAEQSSAPAFADANLVLRISTEKQRVRPVQSGGHGTDCLMAESDGRIIAAMAQDGWDVRSLDEASGEYEVMLPAVEYEFSLARVTMPRPHFKATVQAGAVEAQHDGQQRMTGELVLTNGDEMINVHLGFPLNTTVAISCAGICKAKIGRLQDDVFLQNEVALGLSLPNVPGLAKIVNAFCRSYADTATLQCAEALASGADKLAAAQVFCKLVQCSIC